MFKGWGAYHLSLVAVFAAILLFAGINALVMRSSGGYDISAEATLPYDVDQLWQWSMENNKRSKWQVSMSDLSTLHGDTAELESARMLFFRSKEERWTGIEVTIDVEPRSKWVARQETPMAMRIYSVSLVPLGPCQTKVILNEQSDIFNFTERFWIFWKRGENVERLEYSLRQLKTWMGHKNIVCEAP